MKKFYIIFLFILFSKIYFFITLNSKIILCTIAKMENLYIREFIEHYKLIGVDKIIIFDNNNKDGERFEDVINDYINNDFVNIINYRDCKMCQYHSYEECYNKFKNKYDWFLFFDVDEYLILPNYKNIHDFVNDNRFNKFDIIHVNWIFFDDNDLIYYDNRPLQKRFIRPRHFIKKNYKNYLIKSIIRSRLSKLKFTNSHTPKGKYKVCDVTGKKVRNVPVLKDNPAQLNLNVPYLKHFNCKTVEEFFNNKMNRGFPDEFGVKDFKKKMSKDYFFYENNWNSIKDFIADLLIFKYYNKKK